ncbi:MAG: hypothetical protein KY460_10095 [Actinobacteria bacterium]|nr:hypothetical protein [Actinomycetota bacterium]
MSTPNDADGLDTMVVIAIQVVVAIAVWGLLGLIVDLIAGTGPWVQFVGVLMGTLIALVLAQRLATPPESTEDAHG